MHRTTSFQPWIGLIGVAIGFLLGEGGRIIRRYLEIRRKKRLVSSELRSVLAQIPDKRALLQKASAALRKMEVLPLASVHVSTAGYASVLADLFPYLTDLQRNCLHVIYERLRVADDFMDCFAVDVLARTSDTTIADPWNSLAKMTDEMSESYTVVEALARKYLDGNPVDVFHVEDGGS